MTTGSAVQPDATALERRLGDPWDPGNPLGFAAILAADEREELLPAGVRALDEHGIGAELVPAELGGRLTRLDRTAAVLRAVYRRDPCLALGRGVSSLIAAVNVWAAGDDRQRTAAAGHLLRGGGLACAYHELAHGNDLARAGMTASADGPDLVLHGRKEVIANVAGAPAMVLFCRTDPRPGGRSHSLLLLDRTRLVAGGGVTFLPRFRTAGMRGVALGGLVLDGCRASREDLLGPPGHGIETALRAFQVTRLAVPAMIPGVLDTGLRATLRFIAGRRLYGGAAADLPVVRSVVAGAFADLLIADCLATVGVRAVHLLPEQAAVLAAAVKGFVPALLIAAMERLTAVLGARSFLRGGEHGIFQKLLRDLLPAGFAHAGRAACQLAILPALPALARRAWPDGDPAPAGAFIPDADLPPLRFDRLALGPGGRDGVAAALPAAAERAPGEVGRAALPLVAELRALQRDCAGLPPRELSVMAAPETYGLTNRYMAVLAASACLNVWLQQQGGHDPFLRDPAWILAALGRLATPPTPPAAGVEDRLFVELLARLRTGRSFDLADRQLPDGMEA
jgi:alkylation response protein AidB-like acyl-CoA dehydrogenase